MWKRYKDYTIEVNENGQVRNSKTKKLRTLTRLKSRKKEGYYVVSVTKNNKSTILYVHRLVAELFIENPNNYPCVNHIDNNSTNNNVKNLEWCTYQHNTQMAFHKQNAFKNFVCKQCGKKVFELGNGIREFCSDCKKQIQKKERHEKKKERLFKERQNFLDIVRNNNGNIYYYYLIHKNLFDGWGKCKNQKELAKEQNCSHQNISQIILYMKELSKYSLGISLT